MVSESLCCGASKLFCKYSRPLEIRLWYFLVIQKHSPTETGKKRRLNRDFRAESLYFFLFRGNKIQQVSVNTIGNDGHVIMFC